MAKTGPKPLSQEAWNARFLSKIKKQPSGCWEWQSFIKPDGYARYRLPNRKQVLIHRIMWKIVHGEDLYDLPEIKVCHTCDNRKCVNPDHLFKGTQADNILDMVSKGRQKGPHWMNHPRYKLNPDKVRNIRKLRADGMSLEAIGKLYGVPHSTIGYIMRGKTWRHVE